MVGPRSQFTQDEWQKCWLCVGALSFHQHALQWLQAWSQARASQMSPAPHLAADADLMLRGLLERPGLAKSFRLCQKLASQSK